MGYPAFSFVPYRKENGRQFAGRFLCFILFPELFRMNSLYRTNVCASAAIGANIRINFVNFAFRNCFDGTLVNAGTTSGTVVCDYVCHFL